MAKTALVSGANGLIGRELVRSLRADGWEVRRLVRGQVFSPDAIGWIPHYGMDPGTIEGMDAVIHLAGERVFGVWTKEKKQAIHESRVVGTAALSQAIAHCKQKPRVFVCASAVGYYGDRGSEVLTEESPPGRGFLANSCVEWERAADPARAAGIRTVHLRLGVVLSKRGGALRTMLPAFKLGLAGPLGSGKQYFPWITLRDAVGVARFAIEREDVAGPMNTVAPHAVTNRQYTRTLAKVLWRPAVFRVPAFVLKMLPGRMAQEAILASARVAPKRLLEAGYQFQDPELERALRAVLAR